MIECTRCGHGVGLHRLRCDYYHDGIMCRGEKCNFAKVVCHHLQGISKGFIFPDRIIYCGCSPEKVDGNKA